MSLRGPDGEALDPKTTERLGFALRRLKGEDKPAPDAWITGRREITRDELPVPRLVHWILRDYLGGPAVGRDEKMAWRVWFSYDDVPWSLSHEKFGLRLSGAAVDQDAFDRTAVQVIRDLSRAIRVAETDVFRPFADAQISAGRVTVTNQYHRLRNMYEFFRGEAVRGLPPETDSQGPHGGVLIFAADEFRFHHTVAMVNAYFSLLEHTLVLCWPFLGYQPDADDLQSFIGARWSEKYSRLFDLPNDQSAKHHYDVLRSVREDYGNTYAHGGFDKQGGSLMVHVPGGAMVPAMLTDIRNSPSFGFYPVPEASLETVVNAFDEADTWLRDGPAHFGMEWAESGLPVPFDPDTHSEFLTAMETDEAFEVLIDRTSYLVDQATNMDW